MRKVIVFVLLCLCIYLHANDGAVVSEGDTIHPVQSTKITILQEVLLISYERDTDLWSVSVEFVFHNPTDDTIREKVAFINGSTPLAGYAFRILDFKVDVDGRASAYSLVEQRSEGGTFGASLTQYFTFDIAFLPGLSTVRHSYRYYGSVGGGPDRRGFYYTLETAKLWNGPIKNFYLNVRLPEDSIICENTLAEGRPYGTFIRKSEYKFAGGTQKNGMFIRHGGIVVVAQNYVASSNLFLEIYDLEWYQEMEEILPSITLADLVIASLTVEKLSSYSKSDLRLLRNAIFAWNGYAFTDEALSAYFSKYIWYIPSDERRPLSKVQSDNVRLIQELEKVP